MVSDKRLEVRQPHELGVLPLVDDVVNAVLAVVEDDEVVLVVAGRHLVPIGIANTLAEKREIFNSENLLKEVSMIALQLEYCTLK